LKESVGFGAVVMRSVVRRVLWCGMFCGGGGWVRRGRPAFSTTPPLAAPVTSLSGPLWGRAGANAAAAGLGVNVAPARGWSGPQRCGAARLRAQGWRCLAARLFACAAARAAKVGPITVK